MKDYVTAPQTQPAYLIPLDNKKQAVYLAELFCSLGSDQQAKFFDRVAEIDKEHWDGKGVFQWRYMQKDLSSRARQTIVDMYEHTSEE